MSTGGSKEKQSAAQSGIGTKFKSTSGPTPNPRISGAAVGNAGNGTTGTSQSDKRGKQGQ